MRIYRHKGSRLPHATILGFSPDQLDSHLEKSGLDVVCVTSKHNVQYLLGGHLFEFFRNFDAIGVSRYLPVLIYPRGRPQDAVYLGNAQENSDVENGRIWCPTIETRFWGSLDTMAAAVEHIKRLGLDNARIGVERGFIPADAMDFLRDNLPGAQFAEALWPLERLRAVKAPAELALIRKVSEDVVDAMLATFGTAKAGMSKRQVSERLRYEETCRGLRFDWCLIASGASMNRTSNDNVLKPGDVLSLDSGGSRDGYFGDLCRMGVVGEPDAELKEMLAFIDDIQLRARDPVRDGRNGKAIYDRVLPTIEAHPLRDRIDFTAHGMGVIGHEAPRLTDKGPVTYAADDADRPLQSGMVLSIETTLRHPRGLIKLEDTVAVEKDGCTGYGDRGRGWNVIAG